MSKEHVPTQPVTIKKYRAIQARFAQLYEQERRRYDDVMGTIKEEFFIQSEVTVLRILRCELPATENEEAPACAEASSC